MRPGPSVTAWLAVLRDAIAAEGVFRFTLRGTSMRPTLPTECTIEVVALPGTLRPGMLVVFAVGDALVAHRLVRRSAGSWIAQGDGRLAADRPLSCDQLVGLVRAVFVDERCIWPGRWEPLLACAWVARHHSLRPVRWAWRRVRALRSVTRGMR